MSNHGSRFDREFPPDDLAIVNMGYWDPNADEDSEQADLAPVEAAEAEVSKPALEDAEPAEHEVAAAPLEAEATEDAEDFDSSDSSDSSEEPQEPASRE